MNFVVSAILLVLITIVIICGYIYFENLSKDRETMNGAQFQTSVQDGGELLMSGDAAGAAAHFDRLLEQAKIPEQEGQAKLNLGVARLHTNRNEAVALLKEVSIDERYLPSTRAKAANYVLNEYTATKEDNFAREHIFTGPIWEDFLVEGETLEQAVLRGFEFSMFMNPTPEASMRIAAETAFQMWEDDISQEQKDEYAEIVERNIQFGDQSIQNLTENGIIQYGGTHFTEIATAYNRKGMALDVLYFQEYIDDSQRVEEAFQDALNILLENEGGLGTELFVRYHYADFLIRLDPDGRRESIEKILAPMNQMTVSHNVATFLKNWIARDEIAPVGKEKQLAQPEHIRVMAEISPEFKSALQSIGVGESDLSLQ